MVKCVLRKNVHIRFSNVSQFGPVFKSSSLYLPVSGDSAKYKCLFYSRLGVGLVRFKLDYIGPILLMNILKYIIYFVFRYVAWKIVCVSVRMENRIMWLLFSSPKSDLLWPFGKGNNKVISLTDIWTLHIVQPFHMTAIRKLVHFTGIHQDPGDNTIYQAPSGVRLICSYSFRCYQVKKTRFLIGMACKTRSMNSVQNVTQKGARTVLSSQLQRL
jgi:hypothetical protein